MKKILAAVAVVAFAFAVTASSATAATYNFTRDLTVGSTGADVVTLQDFLISKGHLVMPVGVSKGYFGSLTQSALAKYQASVMISPAAGYFGPITRAHFNAMTDSGSTGGSTGGSTSGDLSGGEGDITDFRVLSSPSNEDLEEGESVQVLGFEFEAEDSDLRVERIDVQVNSTSTDPWDIIESATLYHGDDDVATLDGLDDEDEWSEEDDNIYSLRFEDVDSIVREGDQDKWYVEFDAVNNIDSDDEGNSLDIYIPRDGIRAVDAVGIDIYAPSSDSTMKSFSAEEADAASVTISESDDNPDSGIIVVDDEDETEDVAVLAFEIESEDSDLELDEIRVHATSSSSSVDSLISELVLEIDGEEFEGEIQSSSATATYFVFDIDGDYTVEADDVVEATVWASFNKQENNYASAGEAIAFAVFGNATSVQGESSSTGDDIVDGDISGSADGETMTIGLAGIAVEVEEKSSVLTTPETGSPYVTDRFVFKVTALEDTVYIPLTAANSSSTAGFNFSPSSTSGTTTFSVDQLSDRTEQSNSVKLSKGNSAEFEVLVVFNPTADTSYRTELDEIHFSESVAGYDLEYTAPDSSAFKSETKFVPGN